jgi:hypothetical protein
MRESRCSDFSWQANSESLTVESCARLCKSAASWNAWRRANGSNTRSLCSLDGQLRPGLGSAGCQGSGRALRGNGTYQVTPFVQPMRGRAAILEYWTYVAQTAENIHFGCEILALAPEHGFARWWAWFVIVPQQLKTKLDGVFVIALDDCGRCLQLREWWHKQQPSPK